MFLDGINQIRIYSDSLAEYDKSLDGWMTIPQMPCLDHGTRTMHPIIVHDDVIWPDSKQGGHCDCTGTQYCYQIEVLVSMWICIHRKKNDAQYFVVVSDMKFLKKHF